MENVQRLRIAIRGVVQGVGFRPFVFRLAEELGLHGWVMNSSQGVFVEIEGSRGLVDGFLTRVRNEKPVHSYIQSFEASYLDPVGFETFEIRASRETGEKTALVLPDIATCPDCLKEIFDSANRRYLYPFTNCTHCGPRYSIIESLPYDRSNTAMKNFTMCEQCLDEYHDPADRRFHAQPNACPRCGPKLSAWDDSGKTLSEGHEALLYTAERLGCGDIVAVKGLGGFHLMVDARNEQAVSRLRRRKRRSEKPLAVMVSSLEQAKDECRVDFFEERSLVSPESPIVLLRRKTEWDASVIAGNIAPNNPTLGVMLPYTPLHHILMRRLGFPVVATSGNISDEPICIDEREALVRLGDIADLFLVHDRPIVRQVDDSVVKVTMEREMMLRRSRGFAPLPITLKNGCRNLLSVGAHQKNAIALQVGDNAIVSQHIGDLETAEAFGAFQKTVDCLKNLFETEPVEAVCDLHPDYLSTRYAEELSIPVKKVQHHHAHVASCMAENDLDGPVLGVAWDGTGYGTDGTVWGGEFLRVDGRSFERIAAFRPFKLPGGAQAVKEPRRAALGVLFEMFGPELFDQDDIFLPLEAFDRVELKIVERMVLNGFNSPSTSSAGRLFDAVSALVGLRQIASFEGQGAMELEFAIGGTSTDDYYPFTITDRIDWAPLIRRILEDLRNGVEIGPIAAKFHNSLAEIIVEVGKKTGEEKIVLSGGCFQNEYLTERVVRRLNSEGFRPYWHQRVPPNDGGICLGQLYAADGDRSEK
ncbi:MAG: carbamoyltransferase HypF [Proteobacteria bacterium]|nr:carbamoyltransferase HypF [Pseudomonadota bacterium]